MDAELTGDGADFPMFGVEVTANLSARFGTDHFRDHLLRGMGGNGSTKRPVRPQTRQHSHTPGLFSGQGGSLVLPEFGASPAEIASVCPHSDDDGERIKREP